MSTGIAVLVIIFAVFIKNNFLGQNEKLLVMYFEESVNGLNVGSPVVFKGVQVGKVVRIEINANPEDLTFSIPVYVKMNASHNIKYEDNESMNYHLVSALIEKGHAPD